MTATPRDDRRGRGVERALVAIALVGLTLRLLLAWRVAPGYEPRIDELAYDHLARQVLAGHGITPATAHGWVTVPGQPTSAWNCGQVLLMALVYALAGARPGAVFVLHALLGGLTAWLAGRIALRHLGPVAAVAAAAFTALDPFAIQLSASLFSETAYTLLLLAALGQLLCLGAGPDPRPAPRALAAGALLGLAALFRSTAFYFLPLALAGLALSHGRRRGRAFLRTASLVVLATLLVIAPWAARNLRVHHRPVLLDTKTGYNLYFAYHPETVWPPPAGADQAPPPPPGMQDLPEAERDRLLRQRAIGFILARPGEALGRGLVHLENLWTPFSLVGSRAAASRLKPVFLLPLELLALAGAVVLARRARPLAVLYLLPLHYSLVHFVIFGASRFRLPLDPVLALFAGAALAHLWRRIGRNRA